MSFGNLSEIRRPDGTVGGGKGYKKREVAKKHTLKKGYALHGKANQ